MKTRTEHRHTGRLPAADSFGLACFVLVRLAALVRVFGGVFLPVASMASVIVSAIGWSGAFALHTLRYRPVSATPRLDGRPGLLAWLQPSHPPPPGTRPLAGDSLAGPVRA